MAVEKTTNADIPNMPLAASAGRLRSRIVWSLTGAGVFAVALFLASLVRRLLSVGLEVNADIVVLSVIMVMLFALGGLAREWLYWRSPSKRLAKIINEIRAGALPQASLDRVQGGGLAQLVEPVRSILLDLREQKRLNYELQEEMKLRIINRTDALERQLGVLRTQASRDPLTGIGNRRAFEVSFPQIFQGCVDSNEDLCVLMIDIDNFKLLNDTLGHPAGDEMLRTLGELIRSSVRDSDSAYRVGGDEFVILLPRASSDPGNRLARRLVGLVEQLAKPLHLPNPPALSIGILSRCEANVNTHQQLLEAADKRLYEVKSKKPSRARRDVA